MRFTAEIAQVWLGPADNSAQPAVTAGGTVDAVRASLPAVSPEMPSWPELPEPVQYSALVSFAMAHVCWKPVATAAQPAVTATGTLAAAGESVSRVLPSMPSWPEPPEPARTGCERR